MRGGPSRSIVGDPTEPFGAAGSPSDCTQGISSVAARLPAGGGAAGSLRQVARPGTVVGLARGHRPRPPPAALAAALDLPFDLPSLGRTCRRDPRRGELLAVAIQDLSAALVGGGDALPAAGGAPLPGVAHARARRAGGHDLPRRRRTAGPAPRRAGAAPGAHPAQPAGAGAGAPISAAAARRRRTRCPAARRPGASARPRWPRPPTRRCLARARPRRSAAPRRRRRRARSPRPC